MAGDTARVADMRDGADRTFALAVLASILLHALGLAALSSLQDFDGPPAGDPIQLTARLVEILQAPVPVPAVAPAPEPPQRARPSTTKPARATAPRGETGAPIPQAAAPAVSEPTAAAAPVAPALPGPVLPIEPRAALPPLPSRPVLDRAAVNRYQQGVIEAAKRLKVYPRVAIDNNWVGEVLVLMTINDKGRIADLRIKESSGYKILDDHALRMFENAKPFVQIPGALRGMEFDMELRAIYDLKEN